MNTKFRILTKDEMKQFHGGKMLQYNCSCNDGSAAWMGTYGSAARAAERASYWCSSGGYCLLAEG